MSNFFVFCLYYHWYSLILLESYNHDGDDYYFCEHLYFSVHHILLRYYTNYLFLKKVHTSHYHRDHDDDADLQSANVNRMQPFLIEYDMKAMKKFRGNLDHNELFEFSLK